MGAQAFADAQAFLGIVAKVGAGTPHIEQVPAAGDLTAVANGRLFMLAGDPDSANTMYMALDLGTGAEVCASSLAHMEEIDFVGGGQSLDYDASTDTMVISGIDPDDLTHHIWRHEKFHGVQLGHDAKFIPAQYLQYLDSPAAALGVKRRVVIYTLPCQPYGRSRSFNA